MIHLLIMVDPSWWFVVGMYICVYETQLKYILFHDYCIVFLFKFVFVNQVVVVINGCSLYNLLYYRHPHHISPLFYFLLKMGSDTINHRVAIGLSCIKINPSPVSCTFCNTFKILGALYLLVKYYRYFVLESYRFFFTCTVPLIYPWLSVW